MSSKLSRRTTPQLTWQITAWYAAFFIAGFFGLLLVLQWELGRSLQQMDLEVLRTKLSQLRDELGDEGLGEVRKLCAQKDAAAFFVRVADLNNHTLFTSMPADVDKDDVEELAAKASEDHVTRFTLHVGSGRSYEFEALPVKDKWLLQIGYSTEMRQKTLRRFQESWASVVFPTIAASILLSAFLATRMLKPLRDLNDTVIRIVKTGKLDERLREFPATGEIGELISVFNRMLDRIEALVTAMKGTLDNVAHDLRTPLTRLRGTAELALHDGDAAVARNALAECIEEAERVTTLLNTFMDISEAENGAMKLHLQPLNAAELVHDIVDLYSIVAEEKSQKISAEIPSELTICADPGRIHQAIANLVDNAIKYTPDHGHIALRAKALGKEILLSVSDDGPGIPPEDQERIWERLFRCDKSRSKRGLGLGLSFVRAIASAHNGRVELESTPGQGSTFTLHLPVAAAVSKTSSGAVSKL